MQRLSRSQICKVFAKVRSDSENSSFSRSICSSSPNQMNFCTVKYLGEFNQEDVFIVSTMDATPLIQELLEESSAAATPSPASSPASSSNLKPQEDSNLREAVSLQSPGKHAAHAKKPWKETTLKGLADDLSRAENLYKTLESAELVGLCVFDKTGRIYSCNKKYFELMGFDPQKKDDGSVQWSDNRSQDVIDADAKSVQEIEKYGKNNPYERTVKMPDGREVTSLVVATSLEPNKPFERDTRGLGLLMDITAQKEAQRAIAQVSAMKSTFLCVLTPTESFSVD